MSALPLSVSIQKKHAKITAGTIQAGKIKIGNAKFGAMYQNNTLRLSRGALSASLSSMSGQAMYDEEMQKEEDTILDKYYSISEVMKKVETLKKYAEKHNLDLQETLETFLTDKELYIYENKVEIQRLAQDILKKRQANQEEEKKQREKAIKDHFYPPNKISDYIWNTIDGKFDEKSFVAQLTNPNKLHLLTNL